MVNFESINNMENIYLYAGDLSENLIEQGHDNKFIGLSLTQNNEDHILFDITKKFPIQENTIDIFCAEDVMEHIEYTILKIKKPSLSLSIRSCKVCDTGPFILSGKTPSKFNKRVSKKPWIGINGINEKRNKTPGNMAKKKLNARLADLVPNVPFETASIKNLVT